MYFKKRRRILVISTICTICLNFKMTLLRSGQSIKDNHLVSEFLGVRIVSREEGNLAAETFLAKSTDATSMLEDALRFFPLPRALLACTSVKLPRFPPMEGVRTRYTLIRPGSAVHGRNVGIVVLVSSIPALGFSLLFLSFFLVAVRTKPIARAACALGARDLIIRVELPRIRRLCGINQLVA